MTRKAFIARTTRETTVEVNLDLDGTGRAQVDTGVGFLDHLLGSFAYHALFDLEVSGQGDLAIDDHHLVEDIALVLGQAISEALSDRVGITRFGHAVVPMDEARAEAAVDLSGRPFSLARFDLRNERIGNLTTQNLPHFLEALAASGALTLHLSATGSNDHHIAEAGFKALARAMRHAVEIDPRRSGIPSTKGTL
ncbi:MAG: imidazoleglycerol-phosphate dehydratase HisB [Actinomycetota bacterium]